MKRTQAMWELAGREVSGPRCRVIMFVFCTILVFGCQRGPQRYALSGSVNLDGQPLEEGAISFRPEEGTPGPSAGGAINEGAFSIPASGGPLAGRFRVEISASRPGESFVPGMDGQMVPAYEQFLPARYNSESELRVDVGASGKNSFDFVLHSDDECSRSSGFSVR